MHVIKPMGLHGPSQITSDCFTRVSATTQLQHEFPNLTKPFYIFKLISETCRLCHITIIPSHHPYQNDSRCAKLQNNSFKHQIYIIKIRGSDSIILPPTRHRKRTCLICMELLCIFCCCIFCCIFYRYTWNGLSLPLQRKRSLDSIKYNIKTFVFPSLPAIFLRRKIISVNCVQCRLLVCAGIPLHLLHSVQLQYSEDSVTLLVHAGLL